MSVTLLEINPFDQLVAINWYKKSLVLWDHALSGTGGQGQLRSVGSSLPALKMAGLIPPWVYFVLLLQLISLNSCEYSTLDKLSVLHGPKNTRLLWNWLFLPLFCAPSPFTLPLQWTACLPGSPCSSLALSCAPSSPDCPFNILLSMIWLYINASYLLTGWYRVSNTRHIPWCTKHQNEVHRIQVRHPIMGHLHNAEVIQRMGKEAFDYFLDRVKCGVISAHHMTASFTPMFLETAWEEWSRERPATRQNFVGFLLIGSSIWTSRLSSQDLCQSSAAPLWVCIQTERG